MANGYTKRINEGFSKYINKLNEEVDEDNLDIESTDKTLDEAVPRDLMQQIRNTRDFRDSQSYRRSPWQGRDPDFGYIRGNIDHIPDYQNSEPEELTADEVLRMKKNGEDLSDIYILNDYGRMIKLDREGHPDSSGSSTQAFRSNQALKTTLKDAIKIYKGNIRQFKDTQPEKFVSRVGDPSGEIKAYSSHSDIKSNRQANFDLGANRFEKDWQHKGAREYKKDIKRYQDEINKIKTLYQDGDISRKEMESRLENARRWKPSLSSYDAEKWSDIKAERAQDRYNASNSTNNVLRYKELKDTLFDASYDLKKSQDKLDKVKSGEASGWGYGDNAYYKGRVRDTQSKIDELQRQIESLKRNLEEYNQKLAEYPESEDIAQFEGEVAEAKARVDANQAEINKLLRRNKNESLKESVDRSRLRSDIYNALGDVMFEYHLKGEDPTPEEVHEALEWFEIKFFEFEYDEEEEE